MNYLLRVLLEDVYYDMRTNAFTGYMLCIPKYKSSVRSWGLFNPYSSYIIQNHYVYKRIKNENK